MEQIKYSVIIPIYQAERTIRRCLDSLLDQPHDNVEIILVNDGSTDNSGEICKEFANKNACIHYFEKENAGVSAARNYGIGRASGEYLLFVDSDDYVTPDFFSAADSVLAEYDYDLIQFSNFFTDGSNQTKRIRKLFRATTREKLFPKLIETIYKKKSNAPWAKVYKRQIIHEHQIQFPENIEVGEDRAFFIHYSLYMNSFSVSEIPIYIVSTENELSLSRKHRDDLDEQTIRLNCYLNEAMQYSGVPESERSEYQKALNYDRLRMIYAKAKHLHRDRVPFFQRMKELDCNCKELNELNLSYPSSAYCSATSIPVRWNLLFVIDAIAWKLTH